MGLIQSIIGNADDVLANMLVALIVLGGSYAAARMLRKIVSTAIARTSTEGHIDQLVGSMTYYALLAAGIVIALSRFFNVATLVASLGLSGVVIGFALKDVLGNFLAGLLILAQRPFTEGQSIEVAGVSGKVHAIRIRDTAVQTAEGKLALIPNSTVFSSVIVNDSVFSRKRLSVTLAFPAETPSTIAGRTVLSALEAVGSRYSISEPSVAFMGIDTERLELEAHCFFDSSEVGRDVLRSELIAGVSVLMLDGVTAPAGPAEQAGEND